MVWCARTRGCVYFFFGEPQPESHGTLPRGLIDLFPCLLMPITSCIHRTPPRAGHHTHILLDPDWLSALLLIYKYGILMSAQGHVITEITSTLCGIRILRSLKDSCSMHTSFCPAQRLSHSLPNSSKIHLLSKSFLSFSLTLQKSMIHVIFLPLFLLYNNCCFFCNLHLCPCNSGNSSYE